MKIYIIKICIIEIYIQNLHHKNLYHEKLHKKFTSSKFTSLDFCHSSKSLYYSDILSLSIIIVKEMFFFGFSGNTKYWHLQIEEKKLSLLMLILYTMFCIERETSLLKVN